MKGDTTIAYAAAAAQGDLISFPLKFRLIESRSLALETDAPTSDA